MSTGSQISARTHVSLTSDPPRVIDHGEVSTRRWVAELILDLAGYTPDRNLGDMIAVEPACGSGAFIVPIAKRLLASARLHNRSLADCGAAVRAYDLIGANAGAAKRALREFLVSEEEHAAAECLPDQWISCADYLRYPGMETADFVIGNPPYVRQESVAPQKLAEYRLAFPTMVGRADLYVAFFEKALRSLSPGGSLAFICADRWMRNQYGRELRGLISEAYSLDVAIEMHNVDAFEDQVSAYPSVTLISRKPQQRSILVQARREFSNADVPGLLRWLEGESEADSPPNASVGVLPHWFKGKDSWPTGSAERLRLLEDLNDRFLPIDSPATGTRVGIGVATGADGVFITKDTIDVEPSRLLPLAINRDTSSGELVWSQHFLVNPWETSGDLVDLDQYPKLKDYFQTHGATLLRRHVAAKRPAAWFRTIDKVDHSLIDRPKLLFPDMKMTTHPVLDRGGLYPHHNLYYVVSRDWDLEVLGGLLLSKVAELFVDAYSVRMRGGTLRFQAQYLRRIRVPEPNSIPAADCSELRAAFAARDVTAATEIACRLYDISRIPD